MPDLSSSPRKVSTTPRKLDALLERYGESHRDPRNKAIHWICVPLILWSALAAAWALSPVAALALIAASTGFYLSLSWPLAVGMIAVSAGMVYPVVALHQSVLPVAAIVFVVAWIGQFIGHAIEGRKPSFAEDLKFLLVGPVWLLADLYRRLRIPY